MIHSTQSKILLWKGLRALIFRDQSATNKDLFKHYLECNLSASFFYSLINSHLILRILSATLYYILNYLVINKDSNKHYVTMMDHANEREAFEQYIRYKEQVSLFKKNIRGIFSFHLCTFSIKGLLKIMKIINYLLKKHDLYIVLRAAEYLACYHKMNNYMKNEELKGAILLSDGNPHGFALLFLAYKFQIPLTFISHGEPPKSPLYPLQCKVAFLLGTSSKQKYEAVGSHFENIVLKGHEEFYQTFTNIDKEKPLTLGIFLSKLSSLENIRLILTTMSQKMKIRQILIRKHPNAIFYKKVNLKKVIPHKIGLVKSASFREDVEKCDLILTGISTSLLEVIMHGKACLFCKELVVGNHSDVYDHVKAGLTMYWNSDVTIENINRLFQNISREQIKQRLNLNQTMTESVEQLNNLLFNA